VGLTNLHALAQEMSNSIGCTVEVQDETGGRSRVTVRGGETGAILVSSPALSEPKAQAFMMGIMAGVQIERRSPRHPDHRHEFVPGMDAHNVYCKACGTPAPTAPIIKALATETAK